MLEKFLNLSFEEIIGDRFGRYSKYIIQDRAIPDVRDGLKPVQRRILYAMHTEGNTADKPFRKAAKTIGVVIGNYHPHGDSSVYDALVRMTQEWKMRKLLVEMHGNNGSMDGDPQAAMRYTEARLSAISTELLRDIERNTVPFAPNFDDTIDEPTVLPARYPNLLVNGSTGISSGYATEIPPHHIGEVLDAVILQIEQPDITLEDLMKVVSGPDFPTGGIIQGREGIESAYRTGKGKIVIRAKTSFEMVRGGREQIIITELPYEVNKAHLVRKMDELRVDRKVEGISEVRDESDRNGLRIVIDLKKEADSTGVLNYLFKQTDLQVYYHFNMVAIHKQTPRLLHLKAMISAYIEHRVEVVTRRSQFDLDKAQTREHIVEGLIKAISILDEVIATIRASQNKGDAKQNLMDKFEFTDRQAEAIVMLQLYRLTNTDITELQAEADKLAKQISYLHGILKDQKKLYKLIIQELKEIKSTYTDERRTIIEDKVEELIFNLEVTVPPEEVMVTVTQDGYVKRTSMRSYSASNKAELGMKDEDVLLASIESNTTHTLLLFTNKGNYLHVPVHELPDIKWKDIGQHVANIIPIESDETIIRAIQVADFSNDPRSIVFITQEGMIKRSALSDYEAKRWSKPILGTRLKQSDEVIAVYVLPERTQDVLLITAQGYALRFDMEEVSQVGQKAQGVIGIRLKDGDRVICGLILPTESDHDGQNQRQIKMVYLVTERDAIRNLNVNQVEKMARARRGKSILKSSARTRLKAVQLPADVTFYEDHKV